MSVSTKVPAGRVGGSAPAVPMAGPIAAPRVVGNRRLRTGGIALAVMLLALGAALSAIALVSASRTASYLAVARQVQVGQVITVEDLTTTQLSGGAGLQAIPAAQIGLVVGKYAAVALVPGGLVVQGDLMDKSLLKPGDAQLGLPVGAAQLPSANLKAGDVITLMVLGNNGPNAGFERDATIIDITHNPDGSALMHIAVHVADALPVAQAIAAGVSVILKAQG